MQSLKKAITLCIIVTLYLPPQMRRRRSPPWKRVTVARRPEETATTTVVLPFLDPPTSTPSSCVHRIPLLLCRPAAGERYVQGSDAFTLTGRA